MRHLSLACASVLGAAVLGARAGAIQDAELTDLDRDVLRELSATREAKAALFHYRPGSIDEKALEADVAANTAAFAQLEKTLQMTYRGRVHVFLYADGDDMKARTHAEGGVAAFSTGTGSVHQPHEFRGVHEFVHVWALQFPRGADAAGPDLFATEGLATILAESDQEVPIQSWAAAYAKAGALPASLADLRKTFPQGCRAGVHPYHVAGSFVGFLIERFGMAKVKRWYVDSSEAFEYFGSGFARLEREWREWLVGQPLERKHEEKVLRGLGAWFEPMPEAWRSATGTPLFDGRSLAGLQPEDAARWSVKEGLLVGANDAPWTHLASAASFGPRVGVRAKLRLRSGNAIKLRVDGSREAIFATWSSFASAGEGFTGNDGVKIAPGAWVEVVVVNEDGRVRVYLDGRGVFDRPGLWSGTAAGSVALGVERGVLEVKEWVAFTP
jgi:hypothetical protein